MIRSIASFTGFLGAFLPSTVLAVTLISSIDNSEPFDSDNFGFAVSLSDGKLLIGAPFDRPNGVGGVGSAYLYDAETGALLATFDNPEPTRRDNFGRAVALSGSTAIVAAPSDDPGGVNNGGSVYVFDADTKTFGGSLLNPDPDSGDGFGRAVSAVGSIAVVGAQGDDPGGVGGAGTAYVIDVSTNQLLTTLNNPAPGLADTFGNAVSVSGNLAVVGATRDDPDGLGESGTAYVFNIDTGNLISVLNNPNPDDGDNFGWSVAISGNTVVVGAYEDGSDSSTSGGSAYVFDALTGDLITDLSNPDPDDNDNFGWSVAVSQGVALVAADGEAPPNQAALGTVYAFDTVTGQLIAEILNPDPDGTDFFGYALSLDGTTAAVGTPGNDYAGFSNPGTVYVFDLSEDIAASIPAPTPLTLLLSGLGAWLVLRRRRSPANPLPLHPRASLSPRSA